MCGSASDRMRACVCGSIFCRSDLGALLIAPAFPRNAAGLYPKSPTPDNVPALSFGHKSVLGRVDGLARAYFWRFSDLALAEARNVMGEIENLRVVDRSEHLSHD